MKPIDFDNADLMIAGCVLIIITLAIVAGTCSTINLADVVPLITNFGGIAAALATPGKATKIVERILERRKPKVPEDPPGPQPSQPPTTSG